MQIDRPSFDKSIEGELLKNDFAFYEDWGYGPCSGWSHQDHYTLKLMSHSFGYWLIISAHFGGNRKEMNIGSSNSAQEIIAIRDALSKLF